MVANLLAFATEFFTILCSFFSSNSKKFKDTTTLLPFNMVLKNNQKHSSVAKKPRIARTFYCPNPNCQKGFDTPKQFKLHIGLSKECHEAVSLIIHSKQVQQMLEDQQARPRTRASVVDLFAEDEQGESEEVILIDVNTDNTDNSTINGLVNLEQPQSAPTASITYTTAEYHETKLLKILDDCKVPLYMYNKILVWAKAAKLDGYDFNPQRMDRSKQISHLKRFLNYDFMCHPYQVETELPCDPKVPRTAKSVDVTVFNFTSQLFSLLKDESLFADISNLDVNPKKVFGRYRNNSKLFSTVNSGLIYDMAYKNMIEDKENDFPYAHYICL